MTQHPYTPNPYTPPYAPPVAPATPKTSGLAVAALVLGIVWIYWIGSVLAVIFGAVALKQINASQGWRTGKGLATAGLVLGLVGCSTLLLVLLAAAGSGA
jgi:hypothetical protein